MISIDVAAFAVCGLYGYCEYVLCRCGRSVSSSIVK